MEILLICKKRGGGMFNSVIVRGLGNRPHRFTFDSAVNAHVLRFTNLDEFHAAEENIRTGRESGSVIVTRIVSLGDEGKDAEIAALRDELEAYKVALATPSSRPRKAK